MNDTEEERNARIINAKRTGEQIKSIARNDHQLATPWNHSSNPRQRHNLPIQLWRSRSCLAIPHAYRWREEDHPAAHERGPKMNNSDQHKNAAEPKTPLNQPKPATPKKSKKGKPITV